MRSTVSTSKLAASLMTRCNAYGFCYNWAPLDPRKHTTMNHNPHNMYLQLYEYGQYPDWVHISSRPPRTYEPQVINILVETINQRYGTNITSEFLLSKRFREWNRFLSKDLKSTEGFHELYPTLLSKLSSGIFVRESRLTWIFEQKFRFHYTLSYFDVSAPQTIEDFIERYNESIQSTVLYSNFGFAAEIDQGESPLQKHENQEHLNFSPGVQQLKTLAKENDNIFNRLLAIIH